MSIERRSVRDTYGWVKRFYPVCDYCGAELGPEYSFQDAVMVKRCNGWKAFRDGEEWSDACRECAAEIQRARYTAADDFAGVGEKEYEQS